MCILEKIEIKIRTTIRTILKIKILRIGFWIHTITLNHFIVSKIWNLEDVTFELFIEKNNKIIKKTIVAETNKN